MTARFAIYWRAVGLVAGAAALMAAASCGETPAPVAAIAGWEDYRSEGGKFSMQVPAGWRITEAGGAGGYQTTVRANANNWVVVSQQILPGGLEGALLREDVRDRAIIGAVQSHYDYLKRQFAGFRGDPPEVATVGNSMGGIGSFTCERKTAFGGAVPLRGLTALVFGLHYLYVFDAFGDEESSEVVSAAFEGIVASFRYEE